MLFRRTSHRGGDGLRRCPCCRGRFVCPLAWEPADDRRWHIDLRCGDCGHRWEQIVDDGRAARFDVELDGDLATLRRTLVRLDLERMAAEADAFAAALERDLIEPADFAL